MENQYTSTYSVIYSLEVSVYVHIHILMPGHIQDSYFYIGLLRAYTL